MPEQDRTFWPIYLAKKIEGNAFKEDIYLSDGEKLLKFEAEGREFAIFLRWLEQFIQTVAPGGFSHLIN